MGQAYMPRYGRKQGPVAPVAVAHRDHDTTTPVSFTNLAHMSQRTIDRLQNETAYLAQLGERQMEDLTVPGSIPGVGILFQNR